MKNTRSHYPRRHACPACGRISRQLVSALLAGLLVLVGFQAWGATDLFASGTGGYNTYRIPALYETMNGTLLAFCEGRVASSRDTGDIDVVIRRSFDGGVTWAAQQLVWSDGANTCGNPTVVQDRSNGRVWLFMTWNNGNDTQAEIMKGTSIDVRKIYSCYSDDNGATWSVPVNRFPEVQRPDTRWDATGPGRGIQIVNGPHPGRLIIPANRRNIQSDDHGKSWTQSTWLPSGTSESGIVEIAGGTLLRNDRSTGGKSARGFCRSIDQGTTWGAIEYRHDLVDPICMGSTITANHPNGIGGRLLVFSHPSSTKRDRLTIHCSLDDGVSWPISRLIHPGSSGYSCLSQIGKTRLGLLYERDGYGKITFDRGALAALVPVAPRSARPAPCPAPNPSKGVDFPAKELQASKRSDQRISAKDPEAERIIPNATDDRRANGMMLLSRSSVDDCKPVTLLIPFPALMDFTGIQPGCRFTLAAPHSIILTAYNHRP